jgi:hypothetical protein
VDEPHILGNAGLTGRQQVVRVPDSDEEMEPVTWEPAQVMPPNCLRVFQSPHGADCSEAGGYGFAGPCVGLQQDGSCLLSLVRRAQEQGVEWKFTVHWDEWGNQTWIYAGPPLA